MTVESAWGGGGCLLFCFSDPCLERGTGAHTQGYVWSRDSQTPCPPVRHEGSSLSPFYKGGKQAWEWGGGFPSPVTSQRVRLHAGCVLLPLCPLGSCRRAPGHGCTRSWGTVVLHSLNLGGAGLP